MPPDGQMPRYLYLRRLVVRTASISVLGARAVVVAVIWLAVLPYININVWRFLFWSADVATWMLVPGSDPPFGFPTSLPNTTALNSTSTTTSEMQQQQAIPLFRLSGSQFKAALKAFATQLSHDCFQGQILSCVVVVFFVGIFLLREWILQNVPQPPLLPALAQPEPVQPPEPQLLNRDPPFGHWPEVPQPPPAEAEEVDEPAIEEIRLARLRRFQDPPAVEQEADRREQFLTEMGWTSAKEESPAPQPIFEEASTSSAWREEWEEPETGQQQEARLRHYGTHLPTPPPTTSEVPPEPTPAAPEVTAQDVVVVPTDADDDLWQDETDEDDDDHETRHNDAPHNAARPAGRADRAAAAEFPIRVADADPGAGDPDFEGGFAEEMDGILEAVGLRGPLFSIVQNLCLMIFLCTFVMLTFLTIPYIIGKLLGSGHRLLQLLALPINLLRLITDPVFDYFIDVGATRVAPKVASAVGYTASSAAVAAAPNATAQTGYLASLLSSLPFLASSQQKVTQVAPSHFQLALDKGIRGTVYNASQWIVHTAASLDAHTAGNSTTDRVFCVAFGHSYWLLVLFVYQYFSKPDLQAAIASQSALNIFMDQHVLIIKAVSFIFIELAVFPLGCGLLLDICVMPLFPDASVSGWPDKVRNAPISFLFLRWMGGSIYMFVFAQYVSVTRKVLRPGVLCWIRDPNDPNFHPIRDILDKRSVVQLRKIGASAVMYAGILILSLGVNTYFLRYALGFTGVLPLRWKPDSALTRVPLDLIAVHMVIPWAMRLVDPEQVSEWALKAWWSATSRSLRLSSYMMGGDFLEERVAPTSQPRWFVRVLETSSPTDRTEGGLCRVPADDKAITSGPLIIPVNDDGSPAGDKAVEAVLKQQETMEKQTIKPTYTNLYLPPNYTRRITLILLLLWLSHCALLIVGLSVPLLLGRAVVSMFDIGGIHDFYPFLLGVTMLAVGFRLIKTGRKLWSRSVARSRRLGTSAYSFVAIGIARKLVGLGKSIVLLAGVAGLTPLVVGLVFEQYVIVPLRYDASEVPQIQLWQTWALGLLELRLTMYVIRFFGVPSSGAIKWFIDGADRVIRRGFVRPRVRAAFTRIVFPVTLIGAGMLIMPVIVADILATKGLVTPPATREEEQVLLRKVIGAVQSSLMILGVRAAITKRMESWTDILKDEVFLESTELKNYDADSTSANNHHGDSYYQAEGPMPDIMFR